MVKTKETATVTRQGVFDVQVCVPKRWTGKQITIFANRAVLCGTKTGWTIRRSKKLLAGAPVRCQCAERPGFVHVVLDA